MAAGRTGPLTHNPFSLYRWTPAWYALRNPNLSSRFHLRRDIFVRNFGESAASSFASLSTWYFGLIFLLLSCLARPRRF
jgi:hypothetical protein